MSGCEYYQELISCLLDGELSADEEAALADHLEICPDCAAMHGAFAALSRTMAEDMEEAPESLCVNVMAELRRAEKLKKNRRKRAIKAALATAACAVFVFAAGRLTGFGGSSNENASVAVYDVKMAKTESFAVPADAPAAAAPQMAEDGAAVTGGAIVTADMSAAEFDAMMEAAAEEAAPMEANAFSLSRADSGAGAVVLDWYSVNELLGGTPVVGELALPDSPILQLTAQADGVFYTLVVYELDGLLYYLDPTDGILKESACALSALEELAKT